MQFIVNYKKLNENKLQFINVLKTNEYIYTLSTHTRLIIHALHV